MAKHLIFKTKAQQTLKRGVELAADTPITNVSEKNLSQVMLASVAVVWKINVFVRNSPNWGKQTPPGRWMWSRGV